METRESMRSLLSAALVSVLLLTVSFAADTQKTATGPQILPVDQIQAGMKGVAYTVFEGTKPEPMDLEVLGVLKNANGPKSDLILVRLIGKKPEYTGVVAGMSGSPVYIDGKLVGALSYRIGQFSKEPIAGVTPIAQMLEINELDKTMPAEAYIGNGASSTTAGKNQASKTSVGAEPEQPLNTYANLLTPIEAPLVFSGFSEDALRRFSPQFASAGVMPVLGAGSASNEKQPEPIEPGSSVSAILVRGDMDIAATCTVTYFDADRLLACGHPLMQFGQVQMPMTKSRVVATLPSPMNAFKIINTTEAIGSFVQDRKTGILGRFNQTPRMVPVTLTIRSGAKQKEFHYDVLNNSKLTPVLMMATFYNALQGVNEYGEETTYRLNGNIAVAGFPDVSLQNMFAPLDAGAPTAYAVALSLGDRFSRVFENPTSTPDIKSVDLDVELVNDRRWLRLETARTDVTEARPGDDIILEAVLRPYRGERIVRQIPIKIPTSTPRGSLRILVSDGDTLDRMRRTSSNVFGRKMDLGTTIALLNKEHANHRLYVSMLEANPQAMVEDKVMPTLPLSVMNVMDGMRGTQDMIVTGESAVNESSTPFDYVVTGSQVITVNVK
jgi:SpoIVB peptidase S55